MACPLHYQSCSECPDFDENNPYCIGGEAAQLHEQFLDSLDYDGSCDSRWRDY